MFDNNTLIVCKTCGAHIAKSAATCPHCGAKNKQPPGCLQSFFIVLGIVLIMFSMLVMCSLGSSKKSAEKQDEVTEEEQDEFKPITQNMGRWTVTLTGVEVVDKVKNGWGAYITEETSEYVVVHATVTNNGNDQATFLPVVHFGEDNYCIIKYKDLRYEHRVLLGKWDDLSNKVLNPLETASGIIAFPMPENVAHTDDPLTLVFYMEKKMIRFEI